MNVLLIRPNPYEEPEISEYLNNRHCRVITATGKQEVFRTLAEIHIDQVFYNLVNLDDFALIRYINEQYPLIKVVVISEPIMGNVIEVVRSVSFKTINRPFHLKQLNDLMAITEMNEINTTKTSN